MSKKMYMVDFMPKDYNKNAAEVVEDEINKKYTEGWEFVAVVKSYAGMMTRLEIDVIVYRRIDAVQSPTEAEPPNGDHNDANR